MGVFSAACKMSLPTHTQLVNTEAQTAEEDLCRDCGRMTARFQDRAF